jgi:DMSO/TMAO reductase YedYZ molybdopterin-dependent catalytic subunit
MTDALRPVSLPPGQPKPIFHEVSPENLEYPTVSMNGWMTPTSRFFRRNHFAYPTIDAQAWRLTVDGEVAAGRTLRLADLQAMPQTSAWMTLVCSGNKRSLFEPPAEGTPWRSGAAGNAEWGGVLLRDLLRLTGPSPEAVEVLFTGADRGTFKETGEEVHFARSLPLAAALDGGALLALTMNGEPLPPEHGGPCRLVVPRWYGMASVKWLTRIGLLSRPFRGPFQARDYVYLPAPGAYDRATPVTLQKVDSVITQPAPDRRFKPGQVTLRGVAWGGGSPLAAVEVSLDGGATWAEAELAGPGAPAAWRLWQFVTPSLPPGSHQAMVRATNADGDVQPPAAPWNAKGYGNNAMPRVRFVVALLSSEALLP